MQYYTSFDAPTEQVRRFFWYLLIPLLLASSTLTNQIWSESVLAFGRGVNLLCVLMAVYILYYSYASNNTKRYIPLLIIALLCTKILSTLDVVGMVKIYTMSVSLIFFLIGTLYNRLLYRLFIKQFTWFLVINFILMVTQVSGTHHISHVFNTLYFPSVNPETYDYHNNELFPTLFTERAILLSEFYDAFYLNGSNQMRPPGLLHSNVMLSFVLLVILSVRFGWRILKPISVVDIVLIASIILDGSKICQVGFILVLLTHFYIEKKHLQCRSTGKSIQYLIIYAFLMSLYSVVYPAAFESLGYESFLYSAHYRIGDFLGWIDPSILNDQKFESVSDVYNTMAIKNNWTLEEAGSLSGLVYLAFSFPILVAIIFLNSRTIALIWTNAKSQLDNSIYISLLLLVSICTTLFASPMFGSYLFWMNLGMTFSPYFQRKCSHHYLI